MSLNNYNDGSVNSYKPYRTLSYHIGNMQGVGARSRQEDSFAVMNAFDVNKIKNNGLFFAVCDGMGGMKDGKVASEAAVSSFRQSFIEMNKDYDIPTQLKNSVFVASDKVEALLGGQGGSTAVVCVIYQNMLYYVSVGDSFLYLKRGNTLLRINKEHNMCNQIYLSCIRDGNMNPFEGRNDSEAVALTQFLGMVGLEEVDCFIKPFPIMEGDVFLACSDGVGGVLSEQEVLYALSLDKPNLICQQLEQSLIAHNKPNQDNYTAVVVKCVK